MTTDVVYGWDAAWPFGLVILGLLLSFSIIWGSIELSWKLFDTGIPAFFFSTICIGGLFMVALAVFGASYS